MGSLLGIAHIKFDMVGPCELQEVRLPRAYEYINSNGLHGE